MNTTQRGEPFFPIMGVVLIALVVGGFAPLILSRPGGPQAAPLLLHVHGLLLLGWYVLFIVQARMIGQGNVRLHMTLGKASIALAVVMVVTAYFVIRGAYANPEWSIAGMSPAASAMFPFTDIVNFAVLYSIAIVNRRSADAHKRLMLMAGVLMLDPAIARLVLNGGLPAPLILLLELGVFVAVFAYDFKTRRKPHWATVFGLTMFVLAMIAKLTVAQQAWWASFVRAVFG